MASLRARIALIGATAAAVAVAAAPSANAGLLNGLLGGNCPAGVPFFAPWGDTNDYYPVPNGGLELGSSGWSLSGGAAVASGNEPFYPSGFHSLSLPSGSTATSPVVCIGPKDNSVRMFASDLGGSDGGLHVRIVWYGLLNSVLGISDFTTYVPGADWGPTDTLRSVGGGNVILPLLGSTSARIQLSPIGSGSNWHVDDLMVDPFSIRG